MFNNQPTDAALTSLDADAVTYHEVMTSLVRAGFTRKEAMEILRTHITVHAYVTAGLPFQTGGK